MNLANSMNREDKQRFNQAKNTSESGLRANSPCEKLKTLSNRHLKEKQTSRKKAAYSGSMLRSDCSSRLNVPGGKKQLNFIPKAMSHRKNFEIIKINYQH
jgi:hypothetical protein